MKKKLISICIPVFNENKNIHRAIKEIKIFFEKYRLKYDYEIIFSDNNSNDGSSEIIDEISKKNKKIKHIKFNQNLGYDLSIFFNLMSSKGSASIVIDCDLQDPIKLISIFIEKWEKGFDLIYGVRISKYEKGILYLCRKFFYLIMHFFTYEKYPLYAGDFRLVDRKIIKKFKLQTKKIIFTRCISFDYSKNSIGIPYTRKLRLKGYGKYNFYNALKYAYNFFILKTYFFQTCIFLVLVIGLLSYIYFSQNYLLNLANLSFLAIIIVLLFILKNIKKELLSKHFSIRKNIKKIIISKFGK